MTQASATQQPSAKDGIRPFQVSFPEEELTELRRRINATKWPEKEPVTDESQGVQLATIQKLARYWGTEYGTPRTWWPSSLAENFRNELMSCL